METMTELLLQIPAGLAGIMAFIGLIPFFMAMSKPPKGIKQTSIYTIVYGFGAVGALSVMSRFVVA